MKELWNKLNRQKRYALLVKAYPQRSWELHNLESKLKWDKLLPSTQKELELLVAEAANGDSAIRSSAQSGLPQKEKPTPDESPLFCQKPSSTKEVFSTTAEDKSS